VALVQPIIWLLMYLDLYFTGTTSGLGRYLGSILLDLGIMRPASRQQESEADYIGLMLMAKSCYNPKDAVGVWEKMEMVQKNAPPEWLSTHPSVCFL
jgi:metalloendopeptidase OMA1, mitochondrial